MHLHVSQCWKPTAWRKCLLAHSVARAACWSAPNSQVQTTLAFASSTTRRAACGTCAFATACSVWRRQQLIRLGLGILLIVVMPDIATLARCIQNHMCHLDGFYHQRHGWIGWNLFCISKHGNLSYYILLYLTTVCIKFHPNSIVPPWNSCHQEVLAAGFLKSWSDLRGCRIRRTSAAIYGTGFTHKLSVHVKA